MINQSSTNNQQNTYFLSMTDLMVGVLFIFLIIIFYFVLNLTKHAEILDFYEKNKDKIETFKNLEERNKELEIENKKLKDQNASLIEQLGNAQRKIKFLENYKSKVQNVIIAVNDTKIELLETIQSQLLALDFKVDIDKTNGIIRLPQEGMFETADHNLTEEGKNNIIKLSNILGDILPCYSNTSKSELILTSFKCKKISKYKLNAVFIEGHADERPFSSRYIKDNLELSTKRALSAYSEILKNKRIENLKNNNNQFLLSVSGYGAKRTLPCLSSKTECYAKDRRIDLRFIMEPAEETLKDLN